MRTKKKLHKGSTLVELIMVMTLMMLLGFSIFTMVELGGTTQQTITEDKDSQVDARIALSYINVRVRQNDEQGKLIIRINELTGQNAIVIRERSYDVNYDTWIYFYNGAIWEGITDPGEQPNNDLSSRIVEATDFVFEFDTETSTLTNYLTYDYKGKNTTINSVISLRNGGVEYYEY